MRQDFMLGQYYPSNSWLHRLDSRSKLAGLFLLMTGFFVVDNYVVFGIMGIIIAGLVKLSKVPWTIFLGTLRPMLWVLAITLLLPLFFTPGTVMIRIGPVAFSQEGFSQGTYAALRLAVVIVVTSLLTFTTSPIALTDGLEALLAPFRRLGLPAHELAMMMTIAMRFIPTLLEEARKIINSQKARGARLEQGSFFQRGKAYLPVLIPLFLSAFRRADQLALAMEARCYRGGRGRTRMSRLKWQARDTTAVLFCMCVFLAVILLNYLGI